MEASGKRFITHPSRKSAFSIWAMGDFHYGNPGCDVNRVKKDFKRIKDDPYAFWVGLGDYADYISPRDKRFVAESLTEEARINIGRLGKYYMEKVVEIFEPVKDKCLGLLYGNHEEKYNRSNCSEDAHSWMCEELGVPNLKYSALYDVVFVRTSCRKPELHMHLPKMANDHRESFRFYCHHGAGGGSSPSGKLNSLIKMMNNVDADIYMMGHVHDQKGQRLVTICADEACTSLKERQRIGVITGSYLKTYTQGNSGYGEIAGYQPTPLGACRVQIEPQKRELRGDI